MLADQLYELIPPPETSSEDVDPPSSDGTLPWTQRWTRTQYRTEPTEELEELAASLWPTPQFSALFRIKAGYLLAARAEDQLPLPRQAQDPLTEGPRADGVPGSARRRVARPVEAQGSLFDEPDQPTDPRVIDPGGADLPAPVPTRAPAPSEPAVGEVTSELGSATDFPPSTDVLVPSGPKARARANIAALELVNRLQAAERPATPAEQRVLAAWSGWGAVPEVFDTRNEGFAPERNRLRELLTRDQYRQAEASILNAHYTDPAVVAAIWESLRRAGFRGGRVLEPGCGSGHFIGHAPADAVMVGVENDPITAAITAALYPSAQIRNEGFETTRVPENSFAATVGNVPFGRFVVHDPAHNAARHSIHNHFINKSLALTAPGGYVAVLTSRYTMDSASDAARRDIAERGELIGALRLPSRAFSRVAGTEVVTDLLVLRRRTEPVDLRAERPLWLDTARIALDGTDPDTAAPIAINAYFHEHPDHVLGRMEVGHGLHGSPNLVVHGSTGVELAEQLAARLGPMVDAAHSRGAGLTATAADLTVVSPQSFDAGLIIAADQGEQTGLFTLRYNAETRRIEYWSGHSWETHDTPKTLIAETRELISLRDAANSLIVSQRDGRPSAERDQLRGHLNHLYDTYVRRHGPINRFSWVRPKEVTQERHDQKVAAAEAKWRAKEGEPGLPYRGPVPAELLDKWDTDAWKAAAPYKKRRHLEGGMRHDPGWAVVSSLEVFDESTLQARKAEIFSRDLVSKRADELSASSPEEALAMSLDRTRRVDLNLIGVLLDVDTATARDLLQGMVYPDLDDPDELVPATTALSGNVRQKLADAVAASQTDPVYQEYVAALREVMPVDRTAEEIRVRPGAPWIPAEVVAQFAKETFGLTSVTAEHIGGRWVVDVASHHRFGRLMTETWGMPRKGSDAASLLEAVCNSRSVVVNDDEGVLDVEATFAAQAKASKISEEFSRWVFADEARREPLVAEYNRRFNSLRAPRYDGSRLSLPGLSDRFVPHFYQRNAVARIISEPTTLLDHVVGSGKSGTMFMGAMELKRLGLVRQPWNRGPELDHRPGGPRGQAVVPGGQRPARVGRDHRRRSPAADCAIGVQRLGHGDHSRICLHRNRCLRPDPRRLHRRATRHATHPVGTGWQRSVQEGHRTLVEVDQGAPGAVDGAGRQGHGAELRKQRSGLPFRGRGPLLQEFAKGLQHHRVELYQLLRAGRGPGVETAGVA